MRVERDAEAAAAADEEMAAGVTKAAHRDGARVLLADDDPRVGAPLDVRCWPLLLTVYKVFLS